MNVIPIKVCHREVKQESGKSQVDLLSLACPASAASLQWLMRATFAAGETDWALDPEVLDKAVKEDTEAGLVPFFVCANVGTTSACAVDPLDKLGQITQQRDLW